MLRTKRAGKENPASAPTDTNKPVPPANQSPKKNEIESKLKACLKFACPSISVYMLFEPIVIEASFSGASFKFILKA